MADLRQFDVQGALDAGYSGAEIQWHLMKELGYPPRLAIQAINDAPRQMMGPPEAPREMMGPREAPRTIGLPDDVPNPLTSRGAPPAPERWNPQAGLDLIGGQVGRIARADIRRDPQPPPEEQAIRDTWRNSIPPAQPLPADATLTDPGILHRAEMERQLAHPQGMVDAFTGPAIQLAQQTPVGQLATAGLRAVAKPSDIPEIFREVYQADVPAVGRRPGMGVPGAVESEVQPVGGLSGIFRPNVEAVRGATSDELTAMRQGTLTEEQLDALRKAGRGDSLVREAIPFLHPDEATRVIASPAATAAYSRLLRSLPSTEQLKTLAEVGRPKQGWYRASTQAIIDVFGRKDAARFAGLLAAMSPQTSVESNLQNAVRTWTNWVKAGRPTDPAQIKYILGQSVQGTNAEKSVLDAWVNNAQRALSVDHPANLVLSGPKVDSFYRNLQNDVYRVTADAWIAHATGIDQKYLGSAGGALPGMGPRYAAVGSRIRQAGQAAEMLPEEAQESIWSAVQPLYEGAKSAKMTPSEFLQAGRLTPELIRGVSDFSGLFPHGQVGADLRSAGYEEALANMRTHDWPPLSREPWTLPQQRQMERVADRLTNLKALRDREAAAASKRIVVPVQGQRPTTGTAFMTEEAIPGLGLAVDREIQSAPFGSKKSYTSKIEAPFKGQSGEDRIAKALGLNTIATRNAQGVWRPEGGEDMWIPSQRNPLELNPATAAGARVRLPWSRSREEPNVSPADVDRLNAATTLKAALKRQLAGAWHVTYPSEEGTSWRLLGGKKLKPADRESMGLAAALLDEPQGERPGLAGPRQSRYALADTGGGVSALHMGGTPLDDEEVRSMEGLLSAGQRAIRSGYAGDYINLQHDWGAGAGSGRVTQKIVDAFDRLGKGDYDAVDREVRGVVKDLIKVYETRARTTKTTVPQDFMNLMTTLRDGGLPEVKKALAAGGYFPAIAAAVLVPSLQRRSTSSQAEKAASQ